MTAILSVQISRSRGLPLWRRLLRQRMTPVPSAFSPSRTSQRGWPRFPPPGPPGMGVVPVRLRRPPAPPRPQVCGRGPQVAGSAQLSGQSGEALPRPRNGPKHPVDDQREAGQFKGGLGGGKPPRLAAPAKPSDSESVAASGASAGMAQAQRRAERGEGEDLTPSVHSLRAPAPERFRERGGERRGAGTARSVPKGCGACRRGEPVARGRGTVARTGCTAGALRPKRSLGRA